MRGGALAVDYGTCTMYMYMYVPYCPAVTPHLFATYFQEKEEGRNSEDLC